VAALATVAASYGRSLDYDVLCEQAGLDRRGTDLLALSRMAESLGFEVNGVRASYDAIPRCGLPVIAHVRRMMGGGHFVVVHRWTPSNVGIADPAVGLRTLSRGAFCRQATGNLLLIRSSAS